MKSKTDEGIRKAFSDVKTYVNRYFITTDKNNYVDGMMIAFNHGDAVKYITQGLIEVTVDVFESIGQDSQYIDSKVVQGDPRVLPLTQDTLKAVVSSMMANASVRINTLQDAVDLGDATEKEKLDLLEWRKYRIALSRIDLTVPDSIEWPKEP